MDHKCFSLYQGQELEHYQKLTPFQKSVADALVNIGFKYQYPFFYVMEGYGYVQVEKFDKLETLLNFFHEIGKNNKAAEIRKALNIV